MKITVHMACKVLTRNAAHRESPEGKLWLSVLITTAKDSVSKYHKNECRDFIGSDWFNTICDYAGVPSDFARDVILSIGKKSITS